MIRLSPSFGYPRAQITSVLGIPNGIPKALKAQTGVSGITHNSAENYLSSYEALSQ